MQLLFHELGISVLDNELSSKIKFQLLKCFSLKVLITPHAPVVSSCKKYPSCHPLSFLSEHFVVTSVLRERFVVPAFRQIVP